MDLLARWIPSAGTGTAFSFSGAYSLSDLVDPGTQRRIPSAETGGDGEAAGDSTTAPRIVTISGKLAPADSSLATLRTQIDNLTRALTSGRGEGWLFANSDRFLACRLVSLDTGKDDGLPWREWSATLRASRVPWWQDATEWTDAAGGGALSVPPMGVAPFPIRLEISVSATGALGGSIVIDHDFGTMTLRPTATHIYTIDSERGRVTRLPLSLLPPAVDAIAEFEGTFPRMTEAGGDLTITELSGAAYSDITGYASARWETS